MTEMNKSTKQSVETPVVRVFAPPVSECAGENTWENAVHAIEQRLRRRFGQNTFRVEFVHLFSPEFFGYPEIMQLVESGEGKPAIVTVNDRVVQREGKLSERVIREALEEAGLRPAGG